MMTITESLTNEHTQFCVLFDEIDRLLPDLRTVSEVRLLSRLVEGVLSRHADVESNLAFAALEHAQAEEGQLTRLHQDHEEIDERLHRATVAKAFPEAVQLLKAGLVASREHFHWEEETIFPLFEKLFTPTALETLGDGASGRTSPLGLDGFANALRGRLRKSTTTLPRARLTRAPLENGLPAAATPPYRQRHLP
ncbi:MAG: hemerythrin domain-containing protein [Verrucomicrobia bacterium]|nr:hemerythrin domain-containing protein [Verrucomicrobiota bacterium]